MTIALTRADIAAALPPDIKKRADWYCELRVLSAAAAACCPTVTEQLARPGAEWPMPANMTEEIRLDEAIRHQAAKIAMWPQPRDWPVNWLAIYAGTVAPVELEEPQPVQRKAGRK
jgi:hypothetical protein